jgi:hypothetical protein
MSENGKAKVLIAGNGSRTKELMKYIIEHHEEIKVEVKGLATPIPAEDFVIYDEYADLAERG